MRTITNKDSITVAEYDRMIDDGTIHEDDRVELWEGRIVCKMPKKPPHRVGTRKTFEVLSRLSPTGWYADKEEAIILGPQSKPEPDAAVLRDVFKYDSSRDPTAADCCLVAEVADRSLRDDRGKKWKGYGQAGIPVYWIINLRDHQVEVYTDPDPAGGYRSRVDYSPGDLVPVVIDGQQVGSVPAEDLLP
jgi:Uma2 family endonuclease